VSVKVSRKSNPNYRPGKNKNVDVITGKRKDGK
jgi:hypothetical protein